MNELLAHLTDEANETQIRIQGLLIEDRPVIYFHRLRTIRGSHTLQYLRRYAGVSDQIVVVVDPTTLDKSGLKLTRYEATYAGNVLPELLRIYKGVQE